MTRCIIIDGKDYKKIEVTLDVIPKIGETININGTLIIGKVIKVIHDINTNMYQNDITNHIVTIHID